MMGELENSNLISGNAKTILLVEDEAVITVLEVIILKRNGYHVITANSGELAIEIVDTTPYIDLILMDIDLGKGMDGTLAAEIILEKHDLPLIFLSAHTEKAIVEKTEGISSYGYIDKNSGETILIASINMAFRLFDLRMKELENDAFRKRVFESSMTPLVVMDGETFHYVDCNPAAVAIYGLKSREKTLGKSFLDVSAACQYDGTESEIKCQYYINEAISQGQMFFEWLHERPDKELWDAEVHMMSFYSKSKLFLQFTLKDITTRKRTEEALQESEEIFKQFMENSPIYVFFKDENMRPLRLSRNYETMLGKPLDQLLGKTMDELFPSDLAKSMVADDLRILHEGRQITVEEEFDGHYYTTIKFPIHIEGKPRYLSGYTIDMTDYKLAENEIKRLLHEKTLLLKEVNYRIKNNIASIEGLLVLQTNSIQNAEALSVLQDTISRVQSMRLLYENFLVTENYTQVSSKIYFEKLIFAILELFPNMKKIKIEKNIQDFIISAKFVVPVGIIVNELITNAVKYAFTNRDDGILQITITRDAHRMSIIIADNGVGLPEGFDIEASSGFGFTLVNMLTKQINCSFSIKSHNGTQCLIECNTLS